MSVAFVDIASGGVTSNPVTGTVLTVPLASTPDPGDLLIACGTWADDAETLGFVAPPSGYLNVDIGLGVPVFGSTFNGGTWAYIWVREADGTETELEVTLRGPATGHLVTVARISGALLAAGWLVGDRVADDSTPDLPQPIFTGVVDFTGHDQTIADDGLGIAWVCLSQDHDPGADGATVWTEQLYVTQNRSFGAKMAQAVYTAPMAATVALPGPDTLDGSGGGWVGYVLGIIQRGTHLSLLVAHAGGENIVVPRSTGIALVPPPAELRKLAKQPPEPPDPTLPGSPWVPGPGQYRPPA